MTTVQIIKTQSGEEMVIMSRAEYEALLDAAADAEEDAADVAIYDARKAELAKHPEDRLSPELSARVLKGERFMTAIRNWRGLTQVEVARAAGIAQGYLSDIESGRRQGATETLEAIAKAMDVPARWLLPNTTA
jgi:DNA-binding XRE family transcriptional regulator/PHD/YefM family antitoxin component YafN of YafNO toxin-antitoxin module